MFIREYSVVQEKCADGTANQLSDWLLEEIIFLYQDLKPLFLKKGRTDKELIKAISEHKLTCKIIMFYIRIGDFESISQLVFKIAFKYFPLLHRKEKRYNNKMLMRESYVEDIVPIELFIRR